MPLGNFTQLLDVRRTAPDAFLFSFSNSNFFIYLFLIWPGHIVRGRIAAGMHCLARSNSLRGEAVA